ncbi:hypothetical protein CesoFtcFv8_003880 [Champsocephalus esox]|uniref:Uncharacterized protein n=1 Tax=Champsocephalus esox TaxID=159716 RepID=A0AAN8CZ47_9TELE|nr:hypothetical protein CesoFtcFv8_003880 [Champsocephalus esox]
MYLCVQAASFRLSPLMLVDTHWPQPQTQTPAVDQAWSQRRAALQPRSYRGRTPAKRPAPPKPQWKDWRQKVDSLWGEVK